MIVLDCGPYHATAVGFSPDGRLFVGTKFGRLWQFDGNSVFDFPPAVAAWPAYTIHAIAFGNSGVVYRASSGGLHRFPHHANDWEPLEKPSPSATSVVIPSESLVIAGYGEPSRHTPGAIVLVNSATFGKSEQSILEKDGVRSVACHQPSQTIAWTTGGRQAVVWPITKPDKWRFSLPVTANSLAFLPEGRWLAASQDWNVLPIDTERKQMQNVLKGHRGRVTAVSFHPYDGTLYSASWDGTVRLWDVVSGKEQKAFDWKIGRLTCLAISLDGTRAAVGSESGKVVIWDIS